MSVNYQEVSLTEVMDFFVHGYSLTGNKVVKYESFVDAGKNAVVLKIYTEDNNN